MTVEIIDLSDSDIPVDKSFQWNLTSFTKTGMELSVKFNEPLVISSQNRDKVLVTFMNSYLFFDFAGQEIKNGTQVKRDIPPQFSN